MSNVVLILYDGKTTRVGKVQSDRQLSKPQIEIDSVWYRARERYIVDGGAANKAMPVH